MDSSYESSRRKFLFTGIKTLGILSTANVGIYVIGAAYKGLGGGFEAGAKACPPDGEYCRFLRGYPDGTNQMTWGWQSYGPPPTCTRSRAVAGAGRVIDCPSPYDVAPYSGP
jgi:hypothetical protein